MGSSSTTKKLQTAPGVLCRGHDRGEAWACSQEARAPRSRPAARGGGPIGPPSPLPVCMGPGALDLWVFIPIQEQMKTPSLREGSAHELSELWTPSLRSGTHVMVTLGVYIYHGPFPADAGHGPGGGEPFANLHKGSIWVERGKSEVELHTEGHLVGEDGGGIEPRCPDRRPSSAGPLESQPCTALPHTPPSQLGPSIVVPGPAWPPAIPCSSLPGLHPRPNLLLLQQAPPHPSSP